MSATDIESVVERIQQMPEPERAKAASRIVRELTPDTVESRMGTALSQGRFTHLYAKAMLDYAEGRALDRLD